MSRFYGLDAKALGNLSYRRFIVLLGGLGATEGSLWAAATNAQQDDPSVANTEAEGMAVMSAVLAGAKVRKSSES